MTNLSFLEPVSLIQHLDYQLELMWPPANPCFSLMCYTRMLSYSREGTHSGLTWFLLFESLWDKQNQLFQRGILTKQSSVVDMDFISVLWTINWNSLKAVHFNLLPHLTKIFVLAFKIFVIVYAGEISGDWDWKKWKSM